MSRTIKKDKLDNDPVATSFIAPPYFQLELRIRPLEHQLRDHGQHSRMLLVSSTFCRIASDNLLSARLFVMTLFGA